MKPLYISCQTVRIVTSVAVILAMCMFFRMALCNKKPPDNVIQAVLVKKLCFVIFALYAGTPCGLTY